MTHSTDNDNQLPALPEDLSEEAWCLGCALLHDDVKFTPEMAEQMGQWVVCADCEDIFGLIAESTPERMARYNATFDPEPMVMDIPSAD
jgi:hypothetical protein